MKNLSHPLTEKEIERLDQFLLGRIDDDADTEGKDEGVLGISDLDGFFTAVVSGPVPLLPSRWLPAVWGDFEPVWEGQKDIEEVMSLMMRHMNSIVDTLMEQPEDFAPIFMESEFEGKINTIVDEWCEGYLRGVALAAEAWSTGGLQMNILLTPIRTFTREAEWRGHDLSTNAEVENIQNAIPTNACAIHAYWLARRDDHAPSAAPYRAESHVGRNDPCPCGSGKKYKKCCLH